MADNVVFTADSLVPAGTIAAADEVVRNATAEKQQIVKISLGAEGAFDTLLDSGQQTAANSMPVVLPSDMASLATKLGEVTATLFTAEAGTSVLSASLDVRGYATLLVDVFLSATATVVPKYNSGLGTGSGVTQIYAYNVMTGEVVTAITTSGLYRVSAAGAFTFALQITANTGTVSAAARASSGGEVTPDAINSLGNGKVVTLVNAAVTNTDINLYSLIVNAAMTAIEIRRYRRFKISINNAQNQAAKVSIYTGHSATGLLLGYGEGGLLYYEDAPLEANKRLLFMSAPNVGINASGYIKSIPALDDVHSNVLIAIQYIVAPTAGGTLKIDVEMH